MLGNGKHKRATTILGLASTVSAMALAAPAAAQEVPPTQTPPAQTSQPLPADPATAPAPVAALTSQAKVYTPADFARFAPKTALDMVAQVPGFSIQGGDTGARGLGQANQNVLINGQRVSGKSNDAATALSRIAADAVVRIEIVDGATLDVPGLSGQVANIFVKPTKLAANFKWEPVIRQRLEDNLFAGEISVSGRLGRNDLTASLSNRANRAGNWGPEFVRDAAGALSITRDEFLSVHIDAPRVTGSLARTATNGNILNVNGAYGLFNLDERTTGDITGPGASRADEVAIATEDEWNLEAGADYEFALGSGRLKLIGLQRMEHSPFVSTFTRQDRSPGAVLRGNRFEQTADEGESILRGESRWKGGPADWQVSLEGAYNTLDSEGALFVRDAGGTEQPIELAGATASVSEKRAETILTYGRPLASDLTLQASLGGEYSQITVSGPDGDARSFIRPKGSLSASWKVDPRLTLNAKVERRVDQLSFFDFLASVNVAEDTGNASNPQLVPPQVWRGELEAVKNLGAWGSFSILGAVARATDIVDQVPLSATEEGRGNLPSADLARVTSKATILFDPVGWKGAKLDLDGTWQTSRVKDPLTGEDRELSDRNRWFVEASLRHDVPGTPWAWGAEVFAEESGPSYRLDQIARRYSTDPFASVFVEHKDVAGLTVRASLRNLLEQEDGFERTVYADRRDGPIAFTETRERAFGRIVAFSVTGKI